MIRDPSDGTVRELGDVEMVDKSAAANRSINEINDLILTSTSGLPLESQKPEQQAKLDKSRAWLKEYRRDKLRDSEIGG